MRQAIRVCALLSMPIGCSHAQTAPEVLARLNRFAPSLRALRASVNYTEHNAQIPELDTHETGTFTLQPGGDYKIAQFSNVEINPKIDTSSFDLPKHAKRVRVN